MKATTTVAIVNSAMWLGFSVAVIVALLNGHGLVVFWFYLIPIFGGMYTKNQKAGEEE